MRFIDEFFKLPSVMLFVGFGVGRALSGMGFGASHPAMIPIYIGLFVLMYWEIKQSNKAKKED